jgi:hypothetical protein
MPRMKRSLGPTSVCGATLLLLVGCRSRIASGETDIPTHGGATNDAGVIAPGGAVSSGGREAGDASVANGGAGGSESAPDAAVTLRAPSKGRIVAMGDLHSDIESTRRAFRLAGATDENDEWIGGDLTVIQCGDMIGRSDDERQVLDFLFDIRRKAEAGGGLVQPVLGNHEVMGGRLDNQAVGMAPFAAYEDLPDLNLDDARLAFLPVDRRARGAALMPGGPYAKMLADFPTVLQLGQTIFVHGGVVPRWAEYGIEKINQELSQWLLGNTPEPDSSLGVDDGDRVMWTRQFSAGPDATDCALLDQTLSILGAKRMIVAHTVQPTITPYCDQKVWTIDVGMSRYYGGPIELLEILDDEVMSILRE